MSRDRIVRRRANKTTKPVVTVIINVLIYVILAALILTFAFALYSKAVGDQVFIGNYSLMWVKTGSMEPTIPAQSYILIKKATADDVRIGDVLTFKSTNSDSYGYVITHRVESIIDGEFVTKGDANVEADKSFAEPENVIGVYRRNLPAMSVIGRSFVAGPGYIVIIALILITAILPFVPDAVAKYKQKLSDTALKEKNEEVDRLVQKEIERLKAEDNNTNSNTENTEDDHV